MDTLDGILKGTPPFGAARPDMTTDQPTVAAGPRTLQWPRLGNARDLGGLPTVHGRSTAGPLAAPCALLAPGLARHALSTSGAFRKPRHTLFWRGFFSRRQQFLTESQQRVSSTSWGRRSAALSRRHDGAELDSARTSAGVQPAADR